MGNNSSSSFNNLEESEYTKEKSLFSYNINYKGTKKKQGDISSDLKDLYQNINCKLKLYPSNLTIKNNNFKESFSYYDILSWATSNQLFCFNTISKTYYCIPKNTTPTEISINIKSICSKILTENNKSKLE